MKGASSSLEDKVFTRKKRVVPGSLIIVYLKNDKILSCNLCGRHILGFVRFHARKADGQLKTYVLRCACGHEFSVKASVIHKSEKMC